MAKPYNVPIYEEGEIDIHNRKYQFQRALDNLRENKIINQENKKLILNFIRDCQLGKTIKRKSKKKIGPARCLKYICILRQLSKALGKCFNQISQKEMEDYIFNLKKKNINSWA
jgi:hypothetical protein